MRTLFDLPSHVFFVHLPLVLVPATALAMVVLAIRPDWRRRFGPALAVATLVGAVGTVLAAASGEEFNDLLQDQIGNVADEHQSLGETTRLLAIGFFVAVTSMVIVDRRGGTDPRVPSVLSGLSVLLGLLATVWMIRTGHEGARIVWEPTISPLLDQG